MSDQAKFARAPLALMLGASLAALSVTGCATTAAPPAPPIAAAPVAPPPPAPVEETNPLLQTAWTTPYGAPPFDKLKPEHYAPAFDAGMAAQNKEISAIVADPTAPSFTNTIEAMERAGALLTRATTIFYNLTSTNTSDALDKLETEYSPKLTKHSSAIYLNGDLFKRVETVWKARATSGLSAEQQRLTDRYYQDFVRAGAKLTPEQKARMSAIDAELSSLSTEFGQKVRNDEKQFELILEEKDLAGIPAAMRAAMAETAKSRGKTGYMVTLQRPSVEPFLTFSSRRDLREKAWRAWAARGDNGDADDTNDTIKKIIALRSERAKLLGFKTYADFALDDRMAKTSDAAIALMDKVWKPARATALKEAADLQKQIDAEKGGFQLQAWDWRFYSEKVRAARFDLKDEEVKPYFEMEKMLAASFYTANRLFGVTVKERKDGVIPVYEPNVRVFELYGPDNKLIGLFYGDYFAKPNKNSGAWMTSYRDQQKDGGAVMPIAAYHLNFTKAPAGQPQLLSYDDAETLFHEFGHVLHGLLSDVNYRSLSGTNVARDYVEFPSQVLENWVLEADVLQKYATNAQGQSMPDTLVAKIRRAKNYGQGFATVEFLASAYVDMKIHAVSSADGLDPKAFEKKALAEIGMPSQIIMRHRLPHFGHLFSGGYGAGYYSYLWSDVLSSDAYEAFTETGDLFNPTVAAKFRDNIFKTGNSRDPMANYVAFRGREPQPEALLRSRGFAPPLKKPAAKKN